MGYASYGCSKPELLLLDYAFLGYDSLEDIPLQTREIYKIIVGEELSPEKVEAVSVVSQVDSDYPSVVLMQCEDDDQVYFSNWERMKMALEKSNVPVLARSSQFGGHGYGLGTGMALEGWVDEAVKFWLG